MLPDHAELAATEQAQREAAWAHPSIHHLDPRTHRHRLDGSSESPASNQFQLPTLVRDQRLSILIPPRRSIVELVLQPSLTPSDQRPLLISRLSSSPSLGERRVPLLPLSECDAADLAAERAFDEHFLAKR